MYIDYAIKSTKSTLTELQSWTKEILNAIMLDDIFSAKPISPKKFDKILCEVLFQNEQGAIEPYPIQSFTQSGDEVCAVVIGFKCQQDVYEMLLKIQNKESKKKAKTSKERNEMEENVSSPKTEKSTEKTQVEDRIDVETKLANEEQDNVDIGTVKIPNNKIGDNENENERKTKNIGHLKDSPNEADVTSGVEIKNDNKNQTSTSSTEVTESAGQNSEAKKLSKKGSWKKLADAAIKKGKKNETSKEPSSQIKHDEINMKQETKEDGDDFEVRGSIGNSVEASNNEASNNEVSSNKSMSIPENDSIDGGLVNDSSETEESKDVSNGSSIDPNKSKVSNDTTVNDANDNMSIDKDSNDNMSIDKSRNFDDAYHDEINQNFETEDQLLDDDEEKELYYDDEGLIIMESSKRGNHYSVGGRPYDMEFKYMPFTAEQRNYINKGRSNLAKKCRRRHLRHMLTEDFENLDVLEILRRARANSRKLIRRQDLLINI